MDNAESPSAPNHDSEPENYPTQETSPETIEIVKATKANRAKYPRVTEIPQFLLEAHAVVSQYRPIIPSKEQIRRECVSRCCGESDMSFFEGRIYREEGVKESRPITPDHKWVVYHTRNFTELGFALRGFVSERQGDEFMLQCPTWPLRMILSDATNKDERWEGPIPNVQRVGECAKFVGPFLSEIPGPVYTSPTNQLEDTLRDYLGEGNFNPISEAVRSLELTSPLNEEELRQAQKLSSHYIGHEIKCRLADNWGFPLVLADVRGRPYHSATRPASDALEHLCRAVLEIESSLFRTLPSITVEDYYNFLTSLQLREDLTLLERRIAKRYREYFDTRGPLWAIEDWIASHAQDIRPSRITLAHQPPPPPPLPNTNGIAGTSRDREGSAGKDQPKESLVAPRRGGRRLGVLVDGAKLKQYRGNLSQLEFAEKCDVSVDTIQRGEAGARWSDKIFTVVAETISQLSELIVKPEDLKNRKN